MDLVQRIKIFILQHQLLKIGDKVVVGVSGGPDSVFLLHVLTQLRHDFGLKIIVAHVNHRLRPEAKKDEDFVRHLSYQLNCPFYSRSVQLKKTKDITSIEELARQARLKFFADLAQKLKTHTVALAHSQDDLAETVLMRLIRGTGLLGLGAMPPKRPLEDITIIRPVLRVSRQEIESYLKKNKLSYRLDATNKSKKFFRNKIRLVLLPLLKKEFNPNIKEVLANFSQTTREDYEYLTLAARKAMSSVIRKNKKEGVLLNSVGWQRLPTSLRRLILRLVIEDLQGHTRQLTFAHIREIEHLCLASSPRGKIFIPDGLRVLKHKNIVTFTRKSLIK